MIEKQLLAWKEAEQAAQAAEAAISVGPAAADSHLAAMILEAKVLRTRADALFQEVLAALPADRP